MRSAQSKFNMTYVYNISAVCLLFFSSHSIKLITTTKVKQNYYEPGLPNDIFFNNVPNGVWDGPIGNALYPDLQELDDYPIYQQPACKFIFETRKYQKIDSIVVFFVESFNFVFWLIAN